MCNIEVGMRTLDVCTMARISSLLQLPPNCQRTEPISVVNCEALPTIDFSVSREGWPPIAKQPCYCLKLLFKRDMQKYCLTLYISYCMGQCLLSFNSLNQSVCNYEYAECSLRLSRIRHNWSSIQSHSWFMKCHTRSWSIPILNKTTTNNNRNV